jgi:hypothetical protein
VEALVSGTADVDVGLLVAAAGFGTSGPFLESDLSRELEMVQVNCAAVAAICHHFGRQFADRRRGGLVLMSSLLAFQGVPRAANYAATKAYVQSLAEGLHLELAPLGVDVVACAPGPVKSGFEGRADMQMGMGLPPSAVGRATLAALGRRTTVRPGWLSKALELALLPRPPLGARPDDGQDHAGDDLSPARVTRCRVTRCLALSGTSKPHDQTGGRRRRPRNSTRMVIEATGSRPGEPVAEAQPFDSSLCDCGVLLVYVQAPGRTTETDSVSAERRTPSGGATAAEENVEVIVTSMGSFSFTRPSGGGGTTRTVSGSRTSTWVARSSPNRISGGGVPDPT